MQALRRRCRAVSMYQARGHALPGGTEVVETALDERERAHSTSRPGYPPTHTEIRLVVQCRHGASLTDIFA